MQDTKKNPYERPKSQELSTSKKEKNGFNSKEISNVYIFSIFK